MLRGEMCWLRHTVILLPADFGSYNAGFPNGGFSCAETLLQSLNLAEKLSAEMSEVITIIFSKRVSCSALKAAPCTASAYHMIADARASWG